jgi:LytS/YehU family sensor histidine kinase
VENAIRHGVERRAAPGRIEVAATRRSGTLVLQVQDSCTGPADAPNPAGTGIGLSNTRARLRHLYGERQRCDLATTRDGGAVAVIELPFHRGDA